MARTTRMVGFKAYCRATAQAETVPGRKCLLSYKLTENKAAETYSGFSLLLFQTGIRTDIYEAEEDRRPSFHIFWLASVTMMEFF